MVPSDKLRSQSHQADGGLALLKLLADLDITGTFFFEWERLSPELPFSGPTHTCSASISIYKHKKKYMWTGPTPQVFVLALVAASSRFTRTFSCASTYLSKYSVVACSAKWRRLLLLVLYVWSSLGKSVRFQSIQLGRSIQFTQRNTDHIISNSVCWLKVPCSMGER